MDEEGLLRVDGGVVPAGWIDHNGHVNLACYVSAFDLATGVLLRHVGIDEGYRQRTGCSVYAAEAHLTYERELRQGEHWRATARLVAHDAKRIHLLHCMYEVRGGRLVATNELMFLHVATAPARAVAMPESILARLAELQSRHALVPCPRRLGRAIGLHAGRPV